jgi:hypothetical protein
LEVRITLAQLFDRISASKAPLRSFDCGNDNGNGND